MLPVTQRHIKRSYIAALLGINNTIFKHMCHQSVILFELECCKVIVQISLHIKKKPLCCFLASISLFIIFRVKPYALLSDYTFYSFHVSGVNTSAHNDGMASLCKLLLFNCRESMSWLIVIIMDSFWIICDEMRPQLKRVFQEMPKGVALN